MHKALGIGGSIIIVVALIIAPQVKPSIQQNEILPSDHPFQVVLNAAKNFEASGYEPKTSVGIVFGLDTSVRTCAADVAETGVCNAGKEEDRTTISRLATPSQRGTVKYHGDFDWEQSSVQAYIIKACAEFSKESWVETERDKVRVHCFIPLVNEWLADPKQKKVTAGLSKLPVQGPNATKTVVQWALQTSRPVELDGDPHAIGLTPECKPCAGKAYVGAGSRPECPSGCKVKFAMIMAACKVSPRRFYNYEQFQSYYLPAENLVARLKTDMPSGTGNIFQVNEPQQATTRDDMWVRMETQKMRVEVAVRSVVLAVLLAMLVLLVSTHNFIATAFASLTIGAVCACILSIMVVRDVRVGDTESICLTVLAGFCVDYIVHLGHSYMQSTNLQGEKDISKRANRVHNSMRDMGVSVLSGCLTSLGASSPLLMCTLWFFQVFGAFFFGTIALAWIWASFFFMPLMAWVGPEDDQGEVMVMLKLKPKTEKKEPSPIEMVEKEPQPAP